MRDRLFRGMKSLRLSVTDRCNLRCGYCMPEVNYAWLPKEAVLSTTELTRLARVFVELGVERLRLTGGEPLLRPDLTDLVKRLAELPGVRDLALTTNGVLLTRRARALREAGLGRVTVSLDTLRPDRYAALTGRGALSEVLAGLDSLAEAGFTQTKLDAVIIRHVNDDELSALLDLGRSRRVEVRFIEYMDVGGATRWTLDQVVSRREILERLGREMGPLVSLGREGGAPAERFRLSDGTVLGIISSTSEPFCGSCDRARLTADGHLYTCLYASRGTDLRSPLREGAGDEDLRRRIEAVWKARADRGAEERLSLTARGPLVSAADLVADARLEMHTRGG